MVAATTPVGSTYFEPTTIRRKYSCPGSSKFSNQARGKKAGGSRKLDKYNNPITGGGVGFIRWAIGRAISSLYNGKIPVAIGLSRGNSHLAFVEVALMRRGTDKVELARRYQ